jgi:hypothetical protein
MSSRIAKMVKKLSPGFLEDVAKMDAAAIKAAMVTVEKELQTIEETQEHDDKLNGAKELLRDLSAPYREQKAVAKAKIGYLVHMLKERELLGDASFPKPEGT